MEKKFWKIYIPYITVIVLQLIIDFFILNKVYSGSEILWSIFGRGEYVDGTLWYIFYLFLFYVIFYFVNKWGGYNKVYEVSLGWGILLSLLYVLKIYTTPVFIPIYFCFFPLGIMLAKKEFSISKKIAMMNLILDSIITIVLILLSKNISNNMLQIIFGLLPVYTFVGSFLSLIYLLDNKTIASKNLFVKIGEYSYYIYLFEGILITKYTLSLENTIINLLVYFVILTMCTLTIKKMISLIEKYWSA